MAERMISVELPESTFRKLKKAAELTYRSVADVLVSTIDTSLPAPPNVPEDIADQLAAMHLLSDQALWAASEPSLSVAKQTRLQQLNQLVGERPLTSAEIAEQESLLNSYHRAVLQRAQALAILKLRGHDILPSAE